MEPSFAARFREVYTNTEERLDDYVRKTPFVPGK